MIKAVRTSTKSLHGWSALGLTCLYGATSLRTAFESGELVALMALSAISMVMFSAAVHKLMRRSTLRDSLIAYGNALVAGKFGLLHAGITCGLTVLAMAVAVQIGAARGEFELSIVEGMRTGIFFLVATTSWRLTGGGRLLAIACWIATDIWVFQSVAVPGIGAGFVTLVSGVLTGWSAVVTQEWLDATVSFKEGTSP